MTLRYFLYARKSQERDDRQVASIDDQIAEMKLNAERNGYQIIEIFKEAKSAKKPGRPIFDQMIERIRKGDADGILCWKLNRLARNPIDGGTISWLLQGGTIQKIVSSEREYLPSDNVLMMQIDFGIATQYVKDLSLDVRRGLRRKAFRGWLPVGYTQNPIKTEGTPIVIPDPKRFPLVQELWRLFALGTYSISEIREMAKDMGLRNSKGTVIAYSSLHRMFSNPFYCGYYYWKDENRISTRIEGKHEAMISEVVYNQVQDILAHRSRKTRPSALQFPFRRILTCGECSGHMTAERKQQITCTRCAKRFSCRRRIDCPKCGLEIRKMKNPIRVDVTYYKCTKWKNPHCSQKPINQKIIEAKVIEILSGLSIDQEHYTWCKEKLQNHEIKKDFLAIISSLKTKKSQIQTKLNRLIEMKVDEEIESEEFNTISKKYKAEIVNIESRISEQENQQKTWKQNTNEHLDFALDCVDRFKSASVMEKKRIVGFFYSEMTVLNKSVSISLKNLQPNLAFIYGKPPIKAFSIEAK